VTTLAPITRGQEAALTSIHGARLSAVTYHYLPPAHTSGYVGGNDGFDADITAVALDFGDRGCRTVTWAMDGEVEGLAILGDDVAYSGLADAQLDASSRGSWRRCVGDTIGSVRASWHVTSQDQTSESIWALRVDFLAISVVVALGTADSPVGYMPDELVVVSDPAIAAAYIPQHVGRSAWQGEPIG
jgi:hypothetical protein